MILWAPGTPPEHCTEYPENGKKEKKIVAGERWLGREEYQSQLARGLIPGLHSVAGRSTTPGKSGRIPVLVEWELISLLEESLLC